MRLLVVQAEDGAARLARRDAEALAECLAEMREVLEAPGMGDLGDGLARLRRVQQVAPAAIQALMPDQIVYGAAGSPDSPMQAALRGVEVFGDAVEREMRIAQVIGHVGTDAVTQSAAGGLNVPPSHLLLDGQIDHLRDRCRQNI